MLQFEFMLELLIGLTNQKARGRFAHIGRRSSELFRRGSILALVAYPVTHQQ